MVAETGWGEESRAVLGLDFLLLCEQDDSGLGEQFGGEFVDAAALVAEGGEGLAGRFGELFGDGDGAELVGVILGGLLGRAGAGLDRVEELEDGARRREGQQQCQDRDRQVDQHADHGARHRHVLLVAEVEAVEVGVEPGGAVDHGLVGLGGQRGRQVAEARVGPDAGEFLQRRADVRVGLRVAWVDVVLGVWFQVAWGQDKGVGECLSDLPG